MKDPATADGPDREEMLLSVDRKTRGRWYQGNKTANRAARKRHRAARRLNRR